MTSRIYTRSGDSGDTGLFGGRRVRKDDLRVEAYGTVDEMNAMLGVARTLAVHDTDLSDRIAGLQEDLFQLGADLATPMEADTRKGGRTIRRMDADQVVVLETIIDRYEAELPPLTRFILPGGHPLAASLHLARVVCRRAERRCVTLADSCEGGETPDPNPDVLRYLNRLSDLLFVLARVANRRTDTPDVPWAP